jgi:hypothetical protein
MPETVTLGGRTFELQAMPWGQLKRLASAINRVGHALAAGLSDEQTMDDMGKVISIGLNIPLEELEQLPTDWHEASNAFRSLMRASGMEQEMETALGEARRRGLIPGAPATPSTPGTVATPNSQP